MPSSLEMPVKPKEFAAQPNRFSMNKTTAKTQYKLSTRKGELILQAGQAQAHKAVSGESYRVLKRREGDAGDELAGDVVAQRSGTDLQLDYADGTRLTLQDYFTECKPGADCAVTLAGDTPQGWQLTASANDGAGLADGSTVLYAHGAPEALASMVPTHPGLEQPLAGLKGDLVTYVPQDSSSVGWLAGVERVALVCCSPVAAAVRQPLPPPACTTWSRSVLWVAPLLKTTI